MKYFIKKEKKVNILFQNNSIKIKGPLGFITRKISSDFIILTKKKIFFKKSKIIYFKNLLLSLIKSISFGWILEFNLKGKGFKLFKFKDFLAFDLGYSNLFLFKVKNRNIKLLHSGSRVILFGLNKIILNNFRNIFKKFYYFDKYHNKGLFFKKEKKLMIIKKLM